MGSRHKKRIVKHLENLSQFVMHAEVLCVFQIAAVITGFVYLQSGSVPSGWMITAAIILFLILILFNVGLLILLRSSVRAVGIIIATIILLSLGVATGAIFQRALSIYDQSVEVCEGWRKINLQGQSQSDSYVEQTTKNCIKKARSIYDGTRFL